MKAFVLVLLLSGCSLMDTLGEDELAIATRYAVGKYIAAGETLEDENERAKKVLNHIDKLPEFLGIPAVSIETAAEVANVYLAR